MILTWNVRPSVYLLYTDLSETERHLLDANNRYEMLGQKLSERQSELESTERAVSQYTDGLQSLSVWLDDKEQIIHPLGSVPANQQQAAEKLKEHQVRFLLFWSQAER